MSDLIKSTSSKNMPTYKRQRLILALLEIFGNKLFKVDFQKLLFLYITLFDKDKRYSFIPYLYGCYSFQAYYDMNTMRQYGFLSENTEIYEKNTNCKDSFLEFLDNDEQLLLKRFHDKFGSLKGDKLISYVYNHFPNYAVNSKIANEYIKKELIKQHEIHIEEKHFFTIGYEGETVETFINSLIKNDIHILVDVRKNALSMKFGFSKTFLSKTLEKINIHYLHMPNLGIPSENRKNLNTKENYNILFEHYKNESLKQSIKELEQLYYLYNKYRRLSIMCYEKDVNMCHRNCIADEINKRYDIKITHI
jgi:uncharacterized protein (DUF488 family)